MLYIFSIIGLDLRLKQLLKAMRETCRWYYCPGSSVAIFVRSGTSAIAGLDCFCFHVKWPIFSVSATDLLKSICDKQTLKSFSFRKQYPNPTHDCIIVAHRLNYNLWNGPLNSRLTWIINSRHLGIPPRELVMCLSQDKGRMIFDCIIDLIEGLRDFQFDNNNWCVGLFLGLLLVVAEIQYTTVVQQTHDLKCPWFTRTKQKHPLHGPIINPYWLFSFGIFFSSKPPQIY